MIIYLVIVLALGILFVLSGSRQLPPEIKIPAGRRPFYQGGYYLAEKMGKIRRGICIYQETKKMADLLFILFLGIGVSLAVETGYSHREILIDGYGIGRPQKGEGDISRELQVSVEDTDKTEKISVLVRERQYSVKEKQDMLKLAEKELEEVILGENASADEVRGQVFLPAELQDGMVTVGWIQEPEGLLDEEGYVSDDISEEGATLKLTAFLACEGEERSYEKELQIFPPKRNAWEQLLFQIEKSVKSADEDTIHEEIMKLPEEVDGQILIWNEEEGSVTGLCLGITMLAAALGYVGKESEIKKEKERRRRQLLLDYPELLFKLSMLLGAGMTIQNAFSKVAREYERERESGRRAEIRYAYEEMLAACNEMNTGISEARAYENFGRRCGESGYVKLGNTLSGNLQKGSEGLTGRLMEESMLAMEERRQLAKKMGEEAGTKLLLPMILMLMVVLVILIVPAIMAF